VETETLDPEGAVVANAPLPSRENIERVIPQFIGKIEQAPPAYSAIHVDGERASALARRGELPEMRKRPVTIYRLEILSWEPPYAKIFVHCSSGTYIRSLARDMAIAAGSRGYLSELLRTCVAGFKLEDAVTGIGGQGSGVMDRCLNDSRTSVLYPDCSNHDSPIPDPRPLLPIDKNVFNKLEIPCLDVQPSQADKIKQGKPLAQILKDTPVPTEKNAAEVTAAAVFSDGKFIAMIERQDNKWSYGYVNAGN